MQPRQSKHHLLQEFVATKTCTPGGFTHADCPSGTDFRVLGLALKLMVREKRAFSGRAPGGNVWTYFSTEEARDLFTQRRSSVNKQAPTAPPVVDYSKAKLVTYQSQFVQDHYVPGPAPVLRPGSQDFLAVASCGIAT